LKSKFILIIGILVLVGSLVIPVIGVLNRLRSNNNYPGGPIIYMARSAPSYAIKEYAYYGGGYDPYGNQQPITVNGVTIAPDNPFYWNIQSMIQEKEMLQTVKNPFSTPEALDLGLAMIDDEMQYYVTLAQYVTKQMDYRTQLVWNGLNGLHDKFIYEHNDANTDALIEAVNYRMGIDPESFKKKYIDITPAERQAAYMKADEDVNTVLEVVQSNDFARFIDLSIQQQNDQIKSLQENIAIQEQAIIDNPAQEENLNYMIEDMKRQIRMIQENTIPILQYRLEKHIVPGEDTWQNSAISDIENSRSQLYYNSSYIKMSEEDFNKSLEMKKEYGSYAKYAAAVQKNIDEVNNTILIAQNSINAGKPDMKYAPSGARSNVTSFLNYSAIVAIFGVLLGGWIMASEFQQGTIRLLMIRPRTRTKILLSKFTAALLLCLGVYVASCLLNMLAVGICSGFSDFAFPNYSISGEVNFFVYYLPLMLACIITILIGYTSAFMLSVTTKNTAVSIAVPIVCFVACFIATVFLINRISYAWIAYTPVPYVWISWFLTPGSFIKDMLRYGAGLQFYPGLGAGMLAVMSAICIAVSMVVFKKRDITN
jgi:ABC-2 type transport system permease protein